VCTNATKEGPNGRGSKDLTPKPGVKEEIKELGEAPGRRT
jgi:hypothetical protein